MRDGARGRRARLQARARAPVGLKELADRLGWDKATIHRLLAALERRGYLLRDPSTRCCALGLKIFALHRRDSIPAP